MIMSREEAIKLLTEYRRLIEAELLKQNVTGNVLERFRKEDMMEEDLIRQIMGNCPITLEAKAEDCVFWGTF